VKLQSVRARLVVVSQNFVGIGPAENHLCRTQVPSLAIGSTHTCNEIGWLVEYNGCRVGAASRITKTGAIPNQRIAAPVAGAAIYVIGLPAVPATVTPITTPVRSRRAVGAVPAMIVVRPLPASTPRVTNPTDLVNVRNCVCWEWRHRHSRGSSCDQAAKQHRGRACKH